MSHIKTNDHIKISINVEHPKEVRVIPINYNGRNDKIRPIDKLFSKVVQSMLTLGWTKGMAGKMP